MKAFLIYEAGLGPGRLTGVKAKATGFNSRRRIFLRGDAARTLTRALRAAGADIIAIDNNAAHIIGTGRRSR